MLVTAGLIGAGCATGLLRGSRDSFCAGRHWHSREAAPGQLGASVERRVASASALLRSGAATRRVDVWHVCHRFTMTTNSTRHLAHPPSQHTCQPLMSSPSWTARKSRRSRCRVVRQEYLWQDLGARCEPRGGFPVTCHSWKGRCASLIRVRIVPLAASAAADLLQRVRVR